MTLPYARHLAATSAPGRTIKNENAFRRSARQRRRAFHREARVVIREFEEQHPTFPKPQTEAERDKLCAAYPHFAVFCAKLDGLAAKWGQ